jgi:TM2 domain-containing membrane protein YozV
MAEEVDSETESGGGDARDHEVGTDQDAEVETDHAGGGGDGAQAGSNGGASAEPTGGGEPSKGHDEMFCTSCGAIIKQDAAICPECGVEQGGTDTGVNDPGTSALIAGAGQLIPIAAGAGQLYNGEVGKGVVISVVQVINALLMFVLIGLVTYPLVSIFAIYDAYNNAE